MIELPLLLAGTQAYNKLHQKEKTKKGELTKFVTKYNTQTKPTFPRLPESLKASELYDLDHAAWTSLVVLTEECNLDALDSVKIAAIRQKGLINSAVTEKIRIISAMNNVLQHYQGKINVLRKMLTNKDEFNDALDPVLWYFEQFYSSVHERMTENFAERRDDMLSDVALTDEFQNCMNLNSDDEDETE